MRWCWGCVWKGVNLEAISDGMSDQQHKLLCAAQGFPLRAMLEEIVFELVLTYR